MVWLELSVLGISSGPLLTLTEAISLKIGTNALATGGAEAKRVFAAMMGMG